MTREYHGIEKMMLGVDLKPLGFFSSLWTQTGPWSDTASYANNVDVLIYILAGFLLIGFSIIFPI